MSKKKEELPITDNYELEVLSHYNAWTKDVQVNLTRKNGWNDITDAYYGKLPDDWPFISKTTDPRIRTALIEKNARLSNGKLRGRLVPRETGDIVKGRINNTILNFQWDQAQEGGSMQTKISICDMDTRLYQSKFGLVKWKCEYNKNNEIIFEGNEFTPLDIRNCGMDFSAKNIKDAKWFQYRDWEFLEDLENQKDSSGNQIFSNLSLIRSEIESKKNNGVKVVSEKNNEYSSHVKNLRGLEDRTGTDIAFPTVEIVTEYRRDIWITFAPQHKKVLRVIKNPYKHGKIPVVQLKYYPIQDDPLGESEVETVLPLWKAIQATVCGYMDESILKMQPPLKVIETQARLETIVYEPGAFWLMDTPDAITEMVSNGQAIQYFQTTYSALVGAFNTAMGMLSQGVSNVDLTDQNKTATEIKASVAQQNARDEKNQNDLSEFIKDIMMFWLANNKQFLFSDPKKKEHVIRIVGRENFSYFEKVGLDKTSLSPEAASTIADILNENPEMDQNAYNNLVSAGSLPKYPVVTNPEETDLSRLEIKPKMKIDETGDVAEIYATPEDLDGTYDYIADVRSLRVGADEELMKGRQNALNTLTNNKVVLELLQQEGYRPKVKELLTQSFEDLGLKDSDRFFEKIPDVQPQDPTNNTAQTTTPQMGGVQQTGALPGIPGVPQTTTPISV